MSIEIPDIAGWLDDINSFDGVGRLINSPIAQKAVEELPKMGDLDGVTKGPLDDFMGPVGGLFDAMTVGKAGYNFADAFGNDDGHGDVEFLDGVHDLLDGGSGLLGQVGGSVGAVADSFNAGFTVGDMIAPYVFNDSDSEGSRMEAVPENGEFHAETGNESIDSIIDGVHDISDGNYLDGALDIGAGGVNVAAALSNPGAALVNEGAEELWKWATD